MIQRLKNLATNKNVSIVYACESGSRAWGFASPDSDFDLRFIYTHPVQWYLSISKNSDTINVLDGDFDAVGWELSKTLKLLTKSNIPALEHLYSPISYIEETESIKELREIALECFSPVASMYHYLSMSKKYQEKLLDEELVLKSLFYALRTALAGKWIVEHNSMPPVIFSEMLSLVSKNESDEISNLIDLKSKNKEQYKHPRIEGILRLISDTIKTNEKYAKTLSAGKPNLERMNNFLHNSIINKYNSKG